MRDKKYSHRWNLLESNKNCKSDQISWTEFSYTKFTVLAFSYMEFETYRTCSLLMNHDK